MLWVGVSGLTPLGVGKVDQTQGSAAPASPLLTTASAPTAPGLLLAAAPADDGPLLLKASPACCQLDLYRCILQPPQTLNSDSKF
jgi:hypothetical protein